MAGSYSGTTTIVLPELNERASCPPTTSVSQNGGNVSIAPLTLGGECGGLTIPVGADSIDHAGGLNVVGATTTRAACGTYNVIGSGGFFGREFRFSINMTSTTCYNMNMTINLSR